MTQQEEPAAGVAAAPSDANTAVVRADALRRFPELVAQLGGDADLLLSKMRIDRQVLGNPHAMIPYRTLVHLLERASADLACPDFGMRLAAMQGQDKILGPLGIAMHNAPTVGEAFRYCAEHSQVFSTATRMSLERSRSGRSAFMRLEILLARLPYQRQAVEQALLLTHDDIRDLSRGQVRAREVWFIHEAIAPRSAYRQHFGSPVRFGCSVNGLLFDGDDLEVPIADRDRQIYKLATSFVEHHFPSSDPPLSARVRTIVEALLPEGECTLAGVASKLGMHSRTLQRRLRTDGESFEEIKDGVRRDVALRYIKQSSVPLMRVAQMLGYSDTSVLSRSCYRWFSASPRQLRGGGDDRAPAEEPGAPLEH